MDMGEIRHVTPGGQKHVAVVGSGISGLAAAWLLSRTHSVTLFEAGGYFGGHTNTVDITLDGKTFGVDTGFLVFNRKTYPNLCAMFALLGVPVVESEMSFAVSLDSPDLEWAGTDLGTVFAQRSNLLRPAMWRMIADILRFNREATRMAVSGIAPQLPLGAWLAANHYGGAFRDWYLLPMAAAIWSCPTATMLEYPVATFARFCHNHGLLQVTDRPRWMTVCGGAREYVRRIIDTLPDVRLNCPVVRVLRDDDGVWLQTRGGTQRFDDVVLACHSDQALAILGDDATPAERMVLSSVRYQANRAVLHTDLSLLPRRKKVWSAWNYLAGSTAEGERPVSVSYLLNRLQPLPTDTPVVVSLNPFREPAPDKLIRSFDYAHPVFDQTAVDAQGRLSSVQGKRRTWFAGAWTGYGFHEDGLKSALGVVERLGGTVPWRGETAGASRVIA
jgi:predicted NAD/FAD-binding protein